ncbi:ERF family protein [Enterococcus faecium]|nr:ERF family protein [Enterococcus faecium]
MKSHSNELNELFKAMAQFRANFKQPMKDAKNPFYKSKYVPLENITEAIDKAIEGTGLSYAQYATSEGQDVSVSTMIMHESGQYIEFEPLTLPAVKQDSQALGSAVTYARRYSLAAVFGVTSDVDDDANACSGDNAPKRADKTHIQTARLKIQQLADAQGTDAKVAEQMILNHFKIKGKLDNVTAEQITLILNYLKSAEDK